MQHWKNNQQNKPWKGKRAVCHTKTAARVHDLLPGQTILPEIEVQNGTHWPWKAECFLGMDDAREGDVDAAIPVEMVNIPVSTHIAGQMMFKLSVPLKAHDHAVADG